MKRPSNDEIDETLRVAASPYYDYLVRIAGEYGSTHRLLGVLIEAYRFGYSSGWMYRDAHTEPVLTVVSPTSDDTYAPTPTAE